MDTKWTLEEYQEELKKPIVYPAIDDPDDVGYYKKYAHNLPPLQAYFVIPANHDRVASDDATKNARAIHEGWDNVTEYEREGARAL